MLLTFKLKRARISLEVMFFGTLAVKIYTSFKHYILYIQGVFVIITLSVEILNISTKVYDIGPKSQCF